VKRKWAEAEVEGGWFDLEVITEPAPRERPVRVPPECDEEFSDPMGSGLFGYRWWDDVAEAVVQPRAGDRLAVYGVRVVGEPAQRRRTGEPDSAGIAALSWSAAVT
jgi:hypothetical protein